MGLEKEFVYFCLFGGLVATDNEAVGQFMISQPFFACTVAGLIFGNIVLGWTIGVIFQLPFLVELPTGGSKVSYNHMGGYASAGVALVLNKAFPEMQNLILLLSVLYGFLLSWVGLVFVKLNHKMNLAFTRRADRAVVAGSFRQISALNYLSIGTVFVGGVALSAIFGWLGVQLLRSVLTNVAFLQNLPLVFLKPVLLGAGLGSMFYLFLTKKTIPYSFAGVVVGLIIWLIF